MLKSKECPSCGSSDVFGVTRVVGYFAIIENMNDSKRGEINDRKSGNYSVAKGSIAQPLRFDFGEDGIYLIGKEDCSICTSEKDIILDAIKKAGYEGIIGFKEKKLSDKFGLKIPMNLSFAVMANVDLNKIPAVIAVKDNRVKYAAHLGDKNCPVSFEELTENFQKIYGNLNVATIS